MAESQEGSMIYVGTMRDSSSSPRLYLLCSRPMPHMSHEWIFYHSTGPCKALCAGSDDMEDMLRFARRFVYCDGSSDDHED